MKRLKYSAGKRMGKKVQTRMKQVLLFEEEEGMDEIDKFDRPEIWKNGK